MANPPITENKILRKRKAQKGTYPSKAKALPEKE
jgi:uncharacterized protein YneF (UPF0154 family)